MFHVRVVEGKDMGAEIRTGDTVLTIGRSPDCRLVVHDLMASKIHGEFFMVRDELRYRDLQSRNGSIVLTATGEEVDLGPLLPEWKVAAGDRVRIGRRGTTVVEIASVEFDAAALEFEPTASPDQDIILPDLRKGPHAETAGVLARFLQLLTFDPTDLQQAKYALAKTLLGVFPQADCATLIDIRTPRDGSLKRRNLGEVVTSRRSEHALGLGYSFTLLEEAYRHRGIVCYGLRGSLPEAKSVQAESMASCMCAPVWDREDIVGFVHLHTTSSKAGSFGSRDAQVFAILSSIASLLMRNVRVAREKAKMQSMASVGQVIAGLSHDAMSILGSLGNHADLVENGLPEIRDNPSWQYVREDLEFLRFLVEDSRSRISMSSDGLELRTTNVKDLVEAALQNFRRYFLAGAEQTRVRLENQCRPHDHAFVNPKLLSVALMNCVKNAVDAYLTLNQSDQREPVAVRVLSSPAGSRDFCAISISDEAGGIPTILLERLGEILVSTKGSQGSGLGFWIILQCVERLKGYVQLATSRSQPNSSKGGTVVSLIVPTHANVERSDAESLILVEDYESYRRQIEGEPDTPR